VKAFERISTAATGLATYVRVRRTGTRFPDRERFLAWQQRRLFKWLTAAPHRVDAYRNLPRGMPLGSYPVIDKEKLMGRFEAYNQPRITAATGWRAFDGSRMVGPYHVGASTGTSGNRGLYVISEKERFAWLGAILAKTLPDIWKPGAPRERVAVILPLHTRLYDAANDTGRISLRFFNLQDGPEAWVDELLSFSPTTLIAPPKILAWLASRWTAPPIRRAYAGAEVLDPTDRQVIESSFGISLGQIYMATEGLMGVSCAHGNLHLAEDIMHFELEPVGEDLVSPIITDFSRRTQVMLRYRMNDLLRLSSMSCPCGNPCQVVSEIVGRADDCFRFQQHGRSVMITPDVMRNAILDADRSIHDFRLTQESGSEVSLTLPLEVSQSGLEAAAADLARTFEQRGLEVHLRTHRAGLPLETDRKLRRVRVARSEVSPKAISTKISS